METLIPIIAALHPAIPLVLTVLGGLVVLGQTYVAITPTQDDDAWFAKLEATPGLGALLKVVKSFAPVQRKEK